MKTISLFVILCMAIFGSSCIQTLHAKANADRGVADFHKLYNSGKITEIYSASHSEFKSATSEDEFLKLMGGFQQKLGKVNKTSTAGFSINSHNLSTTIELKQNTTFEQGNAMEVFTFKVDGENVALLHYTIDSKN